MLYGDRVRVGTLLCTVYETWDNGECALTHPNGETHMHQRDRVFPPIQPETVVGYINAGGVFQCPECGAVKNTGVPVKLVALGRCSQTCHECGRLVVDELRVEGVPFPQPPLERWPKKT